MAEIESINSTKSTLYLVATPVGNLEDMSDRAKRVLRESDAIFAEDTRVAKKLLSAFAIEKPVKTYHQHSSSNAIISELRRGKNITYVSDAGAPGVSDPGNKLISDIRSANCAANIVPIPGASALTLAIMSCGWNTSTFAFLGFVPHKKGRETLIRSLTEYTYPVFVFESVHRIEKLLDQFHTGLPHNARLYIGREFTKIHEQIIECAVGDIPEIKKTIPIKGEFVVGVLIRK